MFKTKVHRKSSKKKFTRKVQKKKFKQKKFINSSK